ncbi:conjugal transfer protein TraD [Sphingomonas sp. PAMC 26617]|uniref:conjugal transfer protein TraD n=1 Tax=Sphingomonas sp. PAMC 26617 TaxID=1112216 RepID=UPI0002898B1D|nr:conjugal transfer protein TraD [Sphingomonas sp. PAMC 26617]
MKNGAGYISHIAWANGHAERVRAKDNPSKDDKLFVLLFDKPDRTACENKTLSALLRVERAKETMRAGRGTIRQVTSAKAKEDRRERDHQRFLAAGLMTMVGLLDGQAGKPTWDRATLLGALDAMAKADASEDQKSRWKARGDALLAKPGDHTQNPSDTA